MKLILSISLVISLSNLFGQGIYAPAAGTLGTKAIHKDSSVFVSWGSSFSITRGLQQIDSVSLGFASQGDSTDALGKADGTVVSLGDNGIGIYKLSQPVFNGSGSDFAIFENGFSSNFLELAFVEVSSDGINYFRFPSFSDTQDTLQIGSFGSLDPTYIHNLAGKYVVNYGTPFDLDDIPDTSLLNKSNITHIKIIDVIGNIAPEYSTFDSQVRKVNDPWPTPFASSGFDLDALGLIHVNGINSIQEKNKIISIYPNPFHDRIIIKLDEEIETIQLIALDGTIIYLNASKELYFNNITNGIYFLKIKTKTNFYVKKVVKK